jgi:hypothetical protein
MNHSMLSLMINDISSMFHSNAYHMHSFIIQYAKLIVDMHHKYIDFGLPSLETFVSELNATVILSIQINHYHIECVDI